MNIILIDRSEIDDRGRVVFGGRRGRHIREILRAREGQQLRVGMIRGPTGTGEVTEVRADGCVEMSVSLTGALAQPPAVELVLAMPRPKALARLLHAAASMGVLRIDLVNAWRVDKSYLHSQHLEPARLREHLLLGCEQGATTWLPELAVHRLLMPFMRGALAARVGGGAVCPIVAHPRAPHMIEAVVTPGTSATVVAAIGPEGGWIDRELESFVDLGFLPVMLGHGVWRVETAVSALLAQVELLRRL